MGMRWGYTETKTKFEIVTNTIQRSGKITTHENFIQ